jgi:hypothetical protein
VRSTPAFAICFLTSLLASIAGAAPDAVKFRPAPGCKKRSSELVALEASLKAERKVPYDRNAKRLESCNAEQPLVSPEMRGAGRTRVAIFVFDVTGGGRVVEPQLIGQKSPWSELSQKVLSEKLFEPGVEGEIGITRVGVTMAFVAEFEGRGRGMRRSEVARDTRYRS